MSTFDGHVREFPDIRIDRFRHEPGARPAMAYFLSHVHTDHLVGLDANRGIFVYCSSATREILLKLEKYPHRMNFAKGILESRKRTYKDLNQLLRPIPLETPTEVELGYKRSIRVTLFDANHCTGSTMFLIEGDGNAVLYTGDVRSELWWVNTLLRNPILLPYVAPSDAVPLKRLDNIYLDTTFANKSDPYQEFPSKASGLLELLRKVLQYPGDTLFYLDAWTFGYEEVWQSLSAHLGSKIHVDDYRSRVYLSLSAGKELQSLDGPKLNGARVGNEERKGGCLTTRQCRIHSCEKGTGCEIWGKQFVRLTPIISRYDGVEMAELGAGGGHGDLNQRHELELHDPDVCTELINLCYSEFKDQDKLRNGVLKTLSTAMGHPARTISLDLADFNLGAATPYQQGSDLEDLTPVQAVHALAKHISRLDQSTDPRRNSSSGYTESGLPRQITFPYSRHSSYTELCLLVEAFKPNDITPCTVNEQNWVPERSMSYLFGHIYNVFPSFTHDQAMFARHVAEAGEDEPPETQHEQLSQTPPKETQQTQLRIGSPPLFATIDRCRHEHERFDDEARARSPKRRRVSEGESWPPPDTGDSSPLRVRIHREARSEHHHSPPRRPNNVCCRVSAEKQPLMSHLVSTDVSLPIDAPGTKIARPVDLTADQPWSQPSLVEDRPRSPSRQKSCWQKCITQSRQQSSPFHTNHDRTSPHQTKYARSLLPRTVSVRDEGRTSLRSTAGTPFSLPGASHPSDDAGRPSPPRVKDPEPGRASAEGFKDLRLRLQWEAHDAAMGVGQDWSVMSLVSVQNHQTREMEL